LPHGGQKFTQADMKPALMLLLIFLTGCSTSYYRYEGGQILEGQGGALKTVNGIDIWIEGTPPKKFQVVGVITDNRPGGPIPMANRNAQVAAKARANGGDAVLLQFDERELVGFHSTGSSYSTGQATAFGGSGMGTAYGSTATTGSGFTTAIDRRKAKYYVIQYR